MLVGTRSACPDITRLGDGHVGSSASHADPRSIRAMHFATSIPTRGAAAAGAGKVRPSRMVGGRADRSHQARRQSRVKMPVHISRISGCLPDSPGRCATRFRWHMPVAARGAVALGNKTAAGPVPPTRTGTPSLGLLMLLRAAFQDAEQLKQPKPKPRVPQSV